MFCRSCAPRNLGFSIRSFANADAIFASQWPIVRIAPPGRFLATVPRPYRGDQRHQASSPAPRKAKIEEEDAEDDVHLKRHERPAWQVQKAALKEKLGGQAWNPRKKLSPDTMEGLRHLHSTQPTRFTTPVLAQHFKVSPEAIRRILKSNWRPSDDEYEARMERWNKRGERIWTNLVEMGVKPPKQWRQMGVGRATGGARPKWKSYRRNMVEVKDSASDRFIVDDGDLIPIADGSGKPESPTAIPLTRRL